MEESVIYQEILEKGVLKGKQDFLLEAGSDQFGPAPQQIQSLVRSIQDMERLKRIRARVSQAKDWKDLLETA